MTENEAIHVRKTVRPMRFLFLVPQEDFNVTKQVIRINTALWGGFYNPIMFAEKTSDEILSLFRASHSDVIVNFTSQPISHLSLGLENYQVIEKEGWDGLLQNENEKFQFSYGCDMRPLMRFYWREVGRFQSSSQSENKQNRYFYIEGIDEHWANYSLLEFGQYPNDFLYDYKSNYQKATNCTILQIDASALPELRHTIQFTPLIFTLAETDYFYYGALPSIRNETVIYIGDLNNLGDWIEFWNIRCFYSTATFVHWENLSLFETYIRNLSNNQLPTKDNVKLPDILIQKSSSLGAELFSSITTQVSSLVSGGVIVSKELRSIGISYRAKRQRSYGPPPIEAPIGKAYEQDNIEYLSKNKLEFKVPLPEFLVPYVDDRNRSWCTTVDGWSTQQNDFWLKIPSLGKIEEKLRKNFFFFEGFRISPRENIVLFPRPFSRIPFDIERIYLPNHLSILKSIFDGSDIQVTDYSEKGRYAIAIEEAIAQGQWFGANILMDRGVQAILYRLSKTNGEIHLPRQELEKIVGETSLSIKDKEVTATQLINILIDRKILRIGLELKCSKCYSQGWYHISQFGETFKCHFCFSEQDIPIIDNKDWRYKSSGLFSSTGVGHGSLPVICLNLYLQTRYHSYLKAFYSFNIKFPDGKLGEIDSAFIRHEMQDEPELMVCECKSGHARKEDFDKLEKVCCLMPGTVACLATLKDTFSDEEKEFAKNLWEKGVELVLLTRLDIESTEIGFKGIDTRNKYIHDFVDLAYATHEKYLK